MTKKLFMREKYEKLGQHLKRRSLKNGDIGFCACVHSTSVVCVCVVMVLQKVWSLTQFYSFSLLQLRIMVLKSVNS